MTFPRVHAWRLLRAGGFLLDGGGMFGLIPRTMWEKWTPPDALNRIPLAMNCVLLERPARDPDGATRGTSDAPRGPGAAHGPATGAAPAAGSERILIETGAGAKWSANERAMYEFACQPDGGVRTVEHALAEIGVDPASISHVVVTHLHFDHAGGLTRRAECAEAAGASRSGTAGTAGIARTAARLAPARAAAPPSAHLASPPPLALVFPNARIHMQRQEWLDANANRSTMTRTYLRTHLDPIADRVVLHDGAAEILPGVHVRPLVGHTWGQQGVLWRDTHGTLCYPGDLLPTIHHAHPAASLGYDMLPYDTMLTKRALLAEAEREDWRLVLDHEPGPCVVRARGGRLVLDAG